MTASKPLSILERYLDLEKAKANSTISLNAAECHSPHSVRRFLSSELGSITTEGFPGERFHPGARFADLVERAAIQEAKSAFACDFANVQPHSGSSANAAVLMGLLNAGDTLLGMELKAGGHLSHGAKASFSGKMFRPVGYGLTGDRIDYDAVAAIAKHHRPKLIICGASSYPRAINFSEFRKIADDIGALLLADISHIAGLVRASLHPSPVRQAHVVTMSTYKQLWGPRGGIIVSNLDHQELNSDRLNKAVFPGTQGTPDLANIAAKAAALAITGTATFSSNMQRVLELAQTLASELIRHGVRIVTGGTDTHMVLVDLRSHQCTGTTIERALQAINILANRNVVPNDNQSPRNPSGIRMGTNSIAYRMFDHEATTATAEIVADVISKRGILSLRDVRRLRARTAAITRRHPISDPFIG